MGCREGKEQRVLEGRYCTGGGWGLGGSVGQGILVGPSGALNMTV